MKAMRPVNVMNHPQDMHYPVISRALICRMDMKNIQNF